MRVLIVAALGIPLAACAALTQPPQPAAPPIVAIQAECPTIHEFTPAQNAAIAKALRDPSTDPIWITVAGDDEKMRAQARACIAAKASK